MYAMNASSNAPQTNTYNMQTVNPKPNPTNREPTKKSAHCPQ